MYKEVTEAEEILKASETKRVLVLKHSNACPVSFAAKREVDSLMEDNEEVDVYLVVVQLQRAISNELAEILNVRHESPQFLVIKNREAEKVFNHYRITQIALEEMM